jgi:hypothetical protein
VEIEISVDVVAPDEELEAGGEAYANLRRGFTLPFAPFVGLRICLSADLLANDPRSARYGELFSQMIDPTAIFEIESVLYYPPNRSLGERIVAVSMSKFEPTLAGFKAQIAFLGEFYGFRRV